MIEDVRWEKKMEVDMDRYLAAWPLSKLRLGSISRPVSSKAFRMLKVDRIVANVIHKNDSASHFPGHTLG